MDKWLEVAAAVVFTGAVSLGNAQDEDSPLFRTWALNLARSIAD